MQLDGAVALVTGGAQGLGLEIALELSRRHAKVIVADIDDARLNALPDPLLPVRMDVTDPDSIATAVSAITKSHGPVTVLVNNAGVISSEPFVNIMSPDGMMHDYDRFAESLKVNLHSVFLVTSAVVEQLVRQRKMGAVVNISSISARGNEGQTAYAAAKAGVNAMTVTWSKELGRFGIRVNALAPGFVDTPSTRAALRQDVIDHIETNTPLRRLGTPTNVALGAISLIENDFITGSVLDINGGLTI